MIQLHEYQKSAYIDYIDTADMLKYIARFNLYDTDVEYHQNLNLSIELYYK